MKKQIFILILCLLASNVLFSQIGSNLNNETQENPWEFVKDNLFTKAQQESNSFKLWAKNLAIAYLIGGVSGYISGQFMPEFLRNYVEEKPPKEIVKFF